MKNIFLKMEPENKKGSYAAALQTSLQKGFDLELQSRGELPDTIAARIRAACADNQIERSVENICT